MCINSNNFILWFIAEKPQSLKSNPEGTICEIHPQSDLTCTQNGMWTQQSDQSCE